ncbi:MAG TPA: hypothetical protein PLG30_10780 [Bacteroidia bacterium]|nr:hypothetical protein [Bacteroidia bacterium]
MNQKIYSFDKPDFKISKVINILWCIFLIWYVSINGNNVKTLIFDFVAYKTKYLSNVGSINGIVIFSIELLDIVLNLYLVFIVFFLVRRYKEYRKRLLYLIPLFFVVNTVEGYRVLVINLEEQVSILQSFLFPIIFSLIIFVPLFLTYNSKTFKKMMILNNEEVRKIAKKE